MEAKSVLVFCLQMVLMKYTLAQCIPVAVRPEAYAPVEYNAPGPFISQLTMSVPWLPSPSFAVMADGLVVDGIVSVSGSLPFLGTVMLEGAVPALGQGSVMYNSGNCEIGIVREMPVAGIVGPMGPLLY